MDPYKIAIILVGLAMLTAAWVPRLLERHPLTLPMFYVGIGILLYQLPIALPDADPRRHPVVAEHLTELAVLVALVGAGLRIDTPFSWRRWGLTWRLLGIAMPLSILGGMLLGQYLLGYGLATALLLGAVLAPTDPVLASDVQVHGPGEGGEDPVRFGLTSEAGFNDGLAFPFVWLAVALAQAGSAGEMDWGRWLAVDVAWRIGVGAAVGAAVGYVLMHAIFRSSREMAVSNTSEGMVALAIALLAYGITELCGGYGFLAVFVAAVVIRQQERDHAYHGTLSRFAEQCERLLMALVLILLGGALATGILRVLSWSEIGAALAFVLLVRPLAGWVSLAGTGLQPAERWTLAVFGIRGIGSFYYVAFAMNQAAFDRLDGLWSVVCLVVLLSIVLHGISAERTMAWLDRRRGARSPRGPASRE